MLPKRLPDVKSFINESKPKLDYDFIVAHQPEWTKFDDADVLRVKDGKYVAIPENGKKSAKNFAVVDVNNKEEIVTHLNSKEVNGWLCKQYYAEITGE